MELVVANRFSNFPAFLGASFKVVTMKDILSFIEQKKHEFSRLPLFEFMQDTKICPRQRLCFAPCLAPFVMDFGELNKTVFREEPTSDQLQKIVNQQTYEDDYHWIWFLEDLERLDLNCSMTLTEALEFLWGKVSQAAHRITHEIYRSTYQASPIQKLVVIEAVEATANVFFSFSSKVIQELDPIHAKKYRYFGGHHLAVDAAHTFHESAIKQKIFDQIEISGQEYQRLCEVVQSVFDAFSNLMSDLLSFVEVRSVNFDRILVAA